MKKSLIYLGAIFLVTNLFAFDQKIQIDRVLADWAIMLAENKVELLSHDDLGGVNSDIDSYVSSDSDFDNSDSGFIIV